MARSAPASDRDSSPPTIRPRKQRLRPDTPPISTRQSLFSCQTLPRTQSSDRKAANANGRGQDARASRPSSKGSHESLAARYRIRSGAIIQSYLTELRETIHFAVIGQTARWICRVIRTPWRGSLLSELGSSQFPRGAHRSEPLGGWTPSLTHYGKPLSQLPSDFCGTLTRRSPIPHPFDKTDCSVRYWGWLVTLRRGPSCERGSVVKN